MILDGRFQVSPFSGRPRHRPDGPETFFLVGHLGTCFRSAPLIILPLRSLRELRN